MSTVSQLPAPRWMPVDARPLDAIVGSRLSAAAAGINDTEGLRKLLETTVIPGLSNPNDWLALAAKDRRVGDYGC